MDGETPGPDPQEIQPLVEPADSASEIVQGLRDRIEDPQGFRDFSWVKDIETGKWGSETAEVLEEFREKYEKWPGVEEEERQIGEFLTEGEGGKWQEKALEMYKERFPDGEITQQKWDETVLKARDLLRLSRLNAYLDGVAEGDDDKRYELRDLTKPVIKRLSSTPFHKAKSADFSDNPNS